VIAGLRRFTLVHFFFFRIESAKNLALCGQEEGFQDAASFLLFSFLLSSHERRTESTRLPH